MHSRDPEQPAKVRILFLIDYWGDPGGTERHLAYLLQELDREKFHCGVAVLNYKPNALAETARASGISIDHVPLGRYYTPRGLRQAANLHRHIKGQRVDIVQTFHFKSDVVGAFVARLAGVRHVISSKRDAGDYKHYLHFLLNRMVRPLTQHYIAVSGVVANVLRLREKVPANRISVIHNGVDLSRHALPTPESRRSARFALGFRDGEFVIGMCAWFRPEKDHAQLLDVYRRILGRVPGARLLLVGGGPLLEHFRSLSLNQGLSGLVTLTGPVEDVRPYLHAMDVACLIPSSNEGFSNSVLEKMAAGLPLIVTDIGGNAEAVVDGTTGFVIPARRPDLLESRLLELESDVSLRNRMSEAARRRVEERFSLDSMIERHEALYRDVCARP